MPVIIRTVFEEYVAEFLGVPDTIVVNSGTSALITALLALDLQEGEEVITTPFTFAATTAAIIIAGGIPVFADIKEDDHLIDPQEIAKNFSVNTRAIVPVHLFGRACDMDSIMQFGVPVIEDAAQSFGAVDSQNRRLGTIGDAGCFSFYKTKNLSAFEGGLIAIPEGSSLDVTKMRNISSPTYNKLKFQELGYNFRMPEPCVLIALERLKMHEQSVINEIGSYDEKDGFYPYVTYELPFCVDRDIPGNCPIAEEVAQSIKERIS